MPETIGTGGAREDKADTNSAMYCFSASSAVQLELSKYLSTTMMAGCALATT